MSSFIYPAIFTLEHNVYEVEFPDLDGCLTYGMNMQEAFSNAQEALTGYTESLLDRGIPLPEPSSITAFTATKNTLILAVPTMQ